MEDKRRAWLAASPPSTLPPNNGQGSQGPVLSWSQRVPGSSGRACDKNPAVVTAVIKVKKREREKGKKTL